MAELTAGTGGNRWADTHAMEITIRRALEEGLRDYEIRRYFKMDSSDEVTPAKRRRMARHKAKVVMNEMFAAIARGAKEPDGLLLEGFAEFKAPKVLNPAEEIMPHGTLHPIGIMGELVPRSQLIERVIELAHKAGNYRGGAVPALAGGDLTVDQFDSGASLDGYQKPEPGPFIPGGNGARELGREAFFAVWVPNIAVMRLRVGGVLKREWEHVPGRRYTYGSVGEFVVVRGQLYAEAGESLRLRITDPDPAGYFLGGVPLDENSPYPRVSNWGKYEKRSQVSNADEVMPGSGRCAVEALMPYFPRRSWVYFAPGNEGGARPDEIRWMTSATWWKKYGSIAGQFLANGYQVPPKPKTGLMRRRVVARFDKLFSADVDFANRGQSPP